MGGTVSARVGDIVNTRGAVAAIIFIVPSWCSKCLGSLRSLAF
jgi:hypothetical protein